MLDVPRAQAVCAAAVSRNRRLFAGVRPSVSDDELHSVALEAAWRADATYDPNKPAKWETWVTMHIHRRLIDYYRTLTKKRERGFTSIENSPDPVSGANFPDELPLVARRALEAAERICTPYARRGPRRFSRHQLAACIVLQEHLRLSQRGLQMLLHGSSTIRLELGLLRVPSRWAMMRARAHITHAAAA